MKLELNGSEFEQKLDEVLITNSLRALSGDGDSFLILSKDTMNYIQTCKKSDGYFMLEYQEGSPDEHYECVDEMLNIQKLSMAFNSYFNGSDEWKTSLKWQAIGSSSKTDRGADRPVKLLMLVVVIVLIVSTFILLSL